MQTGPDGSPRPDRNNIAIGPIGSNPHRLAKDNAVQAPEGVGQDPSAPPSEGSPLSPPGGKGLTPGERGLLDSRGVLYGVVGAYSPANKRASLQLEGNVGADAVNVTSFPLAPGDVIAFAYDAGSVTTGAVVGIVHRGTLLPVVTEQSVAVPANFPINLGQLEFPRWAPLEAGTSPRVIKDVGNVLGLGPDALVYSGLSQHGISNVYGAPVAFNPQTLVSMVFPHPGKTLLFAFHAGALVAVVEGGKVLRWASGGWTQTDPGFDGSSVFFQDTNGSLWGVKRGSVGSTRVPCKVMRCSDGATWAEVGVTPLDDGGLLDVWFDDRTVIFKTYQSSTDQYGGTTYSGVKTHVRPLSVDYSPLVSLSADMRLPCSDDLGYVYDLRGNEVHRYDLNSGAFVSKGFVFSANPDLSTGYPARLVEMMYVGNGKMMVGGSVKVKATSLAHSNGDDEVAAIWVVSVDPGQASSASRIWTDHVGVYPIAMAKHFVYTGTVLRFVAAYGTQFGFGGSPSFNTWLWEITTGSV